MAVELESTIMAEIGLGNNYRWFNGSGSCRYIREAAVEKLQAAAKNHNLSIAPAWLKHCRLANEADEVDGQQYTLTNTWVACSYAIQDAIYRSHGDKGFSPDIHRFHFFTDEARRYWEARSGRAAWHTAA